MQEYDVVECIECITKIKLGHIYGYTTVQGASAVSQYYIFLEPHSGRVRTWFPL